MTNDGRRPDFVVIGTMKSGTTSLYNWLGAHPDVELPRIKEPHFFSHEEVWERGLDWYTGLFGSVDRAKLTGEFSVSYTDPAYAALAAQRLKATAPDARLVCVLREPRARLRSHYMHEVRRAREHRPFAEAVSDGSAPYVRCSEYSQALRPWFDAFPNDQLLVLPLDSLSLASEDGWSQLLGHLGLPYSRRNGALANVTTEKAQFTPTMLWLFEHGLTRHMNRLPPSVRRVGRVLLLRRGTKYEELLRSVGAAHLPAEVERRLAEDSRHLSDLLGQPLMPW